MDTRDKNTGSLIDLVLLAIEAAREVYQEQAFLRWAAAWTDGSNRSFGSSAAMANELVGVVHSLAAEVFDPASEARHQQLSAKPPVAHSAFEEAMKLEETERRDLARKTYAAKAAAGSAGAAAMLAIGDELPARLQAQSALAAVELARSA